VDIHASKVGSRIYLLRHDGTAYSQRGAYCVALDPELMQEGNQMAEAFAENYRSIAWIAVYVLYERELDVYSFDMTI